MNSLNQYNKKCTHGDKIKINLQCGGDLVDRDHLDNVSITHVVFHGHIASDRTMILPENIFLIMPICCGFTVYTSLDENEYFDDPEDSVVVKTNSDADNVLQFGRKKLLVLKPGDKYCDLEIEPVLDLMIEEGIMTHEEKRSGSRIMFPLFQSLHVMPKQAREQRIQQMQNLTMIEGHVNIPIKQEYFNSHITQDDFDLLHLMNADLRTKFIKKAEDMKMMRDIDIIKSVIENDFESSQQQAILTSRHMMLQSATRSLLTNHDIQILLFNVLGDKIKKELYKIYDYHIGFFLKNSKKTSDIEVNKIINRLKSLFNIKSEDSRKNLELSSGTFLEDITLLCDILNDLLFHVKWTYEHSKNQNDLTNKELLTQVLEKMNSETSLKEILQTVMNEIFDKGVYSFTKELNIENFVWVEQKTDIYNIVFEQENNSTFTKSFFYYDIEDLRLVGKMMEDIRVLDSTMLNFFGGLIKISLMSKDEKQFLKSKYLEFPSGEVKIFLSDVINFIASIKMPHDIKFVFSKTCQGFEDDTTTCHVSKCFSMLSRKLAMYDPYDEEKGVFNQKDLKILVDVLKFVGRYVEDPAYAYNFDEELNHVYFSVQCVMHSLNIKNPDVLARNFIYFINKNYPQLVEHLIYSFKAETQPQDLWKTTHMKVIIAICNLFISETYFLMKRKKVLDEKTKWIKRKMGDLLY